MASAMKAYLEDHGWYTSSLSSSLGGQGSRIPLVISQEEMAGALRFKAISASYMTETSDFIKQTVLQPAGSENKAPNILEDKNQHFR